MNGFMCGKFGCIPIDFDDEAAKKAEEKRILWAIGYHRQHGQYPSVEKQEEFWDAEYTRIAKIRIHKQRCPECGQELPDLDL